MSKKRILIVDDEPQISRLAKAILDSTGNYETLEEHRSSRAIATMRDFQPDLVFLDVDMPGVDGGELASRMNADPTFRDTPVVFLTALVSKEDVSRASRRGGFRYLAKPAGVSALLGCVEEILGAAATT